jgi:hypothetical protein
MSHFLLRNIFLNFIDLLLTAPSFLVDLMLLYFSFYYCLCNSFLSTRFLWFRSFFHSFFISSKLFSFRLVNCFCHFLSTCSLGFGGIFSNSLRFDIFRLSLMGMIDFLYEFIQLFDCFNLLVVNLLLFILFLSSHSRR